MGCTISIQAEDKRDFEQPKPQPAPVVKVETTYKLVGGVPFAAGGFDTPMTQLIYDNTGSAKPTSDETMAYTALEKGAKLEYMEYTMPALGPNDVEIEVTHNGLCHTDIHMRDNDWGVSGYPFIGGHEVVGIVQYCGDGVTLLRPGMRVGVGWLKGSCNTCNHCGKGEQNICKNFYDGLIVGEGAFASENPCGGFARTIRVNEKFAFALPDEISSEQAAPLLCAGGTVWAPLRRYINRPDMEVGIAGIGGLGHLALKIAVALGANVTAISSSEKKRELAKKCGAQGYLNMSNEDERTAAVRKFDLILNTIPFEVDNQEYVNLVGFGGIYCVVGIPTNKIAVSVPEYVFFQKTVSGSIVAGCKDMTELFPFCVKHNILPEVVVTTMDKINECMEDVYSNKVPHRYVLTFDSKRESGGAGIQE